MNKYDCTRALDYAHERDRMCVAMNNDCRHCPFWNFNCDDITEGQINVLQRWSDAHPEAPRITLEEQNFLEAFKDEDLTISRQGNRLILGVMSYVCTELYDSMFPFITGDRYWTIGELLKLEVEE